MTGFGPLVAPGPELSDAEASRYARSTAIRALGSEGQRRLRAARVCVVGAGGLGSPVLAYLAGAGVGRLTVVDHDTVEVHNLHRQVIHDTGGVGTLKAESAAAHLRGLNPDVEVEARPVRLEATNAASVLAGHDVLVDATDNIPVRYAIADAAAELDLPVVWGAVSGVAAQVSVFWASRGVGLRTLFPTPPPPQDVTHIDDVGVLGPMTGVAGSLMAVEVIKLVTGAGEPLFGRILFYDSLRASVAEVPLGATRAGEA